MNKESIENENQRVIANWNAVISLRKLNYTNKKVCHHLSISEKDLIKLENDYMKLTTNDNMKKQLVTIEILKEGDSARATFEKYSFQPKLTPQLDKLNGDFNQEIINEIVLWKVNRYAKLSHETMKLLNMVSKRSKNIDIELTENILTKLLETKGVRLAMATTFLRFKNPNIYQIIDQRVYRVIFGKKLKESTVVEKQIKLYLNYLTKLKEVCLKYNINFEESDRDLYQLDKEFNKDIKLKY